LLINSGLATNVGLNQQRVAVCRHRPAVLPIVPLAPGRLSTMNCCPDLRPLPILALSRLPCARRIG
jgi:hypothetical protein